MKITEEKIRHISQEAKRHLGPDANVNMLKKVVKAVVHRLMEEPMPEKNTCKNEE